MLHLPARRKHLNEIIAYCGLVCQGCPIHLLSLENDEEKRQKIKIEIARICREQYGYGAEFKAEDITDCDGCRAITGRLFSGCSNCDIRKCAIRRNLESCAFCPEYACDKLKVLFSKEYNVQVQLEKIRENILKK